MIDAGLLKGFALSSYCRIVLEILDGLVAKAETELMSEHPMDMEAVKARHAIAYARATMLQEFKQILHQEPEPKEPERPSDAELVLKSIQGV